MEKDKKFQSVILAALLHDIGKFGERSGEKLTPEDNNLLNLCCPHYQNRFSHYHVLHSGRFIRQYLGKEFSLVENLVLYHHLPDNFIGDKRLSKIITLADWLSSGERRGRENEEKGKPKEEPIISLFSSLGKDNEYFPLTSLQSDLSGFFPKNNPKDALLPNSYSNLWKEFDEEFQKIDLSRSFEFYLSQIFYLLKKYTFFIPASVWLDKPDISLFHHLKTTSAIASCLYQLNLPEKEIDKILEGIRNFSDREGGNLLDAKIFLIGGDISGIQDFIYSVTSKNALKGLRGRSFYLQLLSEAIAKTILRNYQLPITNLLSSEGGHFYLLVPGGKENEAKLDELKKRINTVLLDAHRGRLSVIISSLPLKWKDFLGENFGKIWEKLGQLLAREKRRKQSNLLEEKYKQIFGPYDEGGRKKPCSICGEEQKEEIEIICPLCHSFEKLSKDLLKNFLIEELVEEKSSSETIKEWEETLSNLGWNYQFSDRIEKHKNVYSINDLNFLEEGAVGFKLLARHIATKDGNIKELEEIAKEAKGIKNWGVLRADVDNLSKIFRAGLKKDKTISRLTTLSSLLSLYFSVGIENIAKDSKYSDKDYLVYSGGDDLFLIGSWSILPGIAQEIYNNFGKFTSYNCTLSSGIFLAPSDKFPIYQAADEAGKAVEKAKDKGRNKITFFDQPLTWQELKELSEIKDKIVSLLENKMPPSLLSILYSSWKDKELAKKGISMERIWRLLYGLKRLIGRVFSEFSEKEEWEKLEGLRETFITNNSLRPHLNIAVRWAEYLTRKEER